MNEIFLAVGRRTYELCNERYSRLQQAFELYDLKISASIECLLRHGSTAFVLLPVTSKRVAQPLFNYCNEVFVFDGRCVMWLGACLILS